MTARSTLLAFVMAAGFAIHPAAAQGPVEVIDGDTVRAGGASVRLVGIDAPETGRRARCPAEAAKGTSATQRLRQLIAGARQTRLEIVACSCAPGTAGTRRCNYGRACGRLFVDGQDAGAILLREGLAARYDYDWRAPPQRTDWCRR